MSSFQRATRRSRRGEGSDKSSTFIPGSSPSKLPPAVRKLVSENGWTHKASATKKQVIQSEAIVINEPVIDNELTSSSSSEDEEEEEEEDERYFRFLGETEALQELFRESAVCRHCKKGQLQVTFDTVCMATKVQTRCSNCSTQSSTDVQRTTLPSTNWERTSDYAANCLFVLSMMLSGDGGTEATKIMGLLDLPRAQSMAKSNYQTLEDDVSTKIIAYTKELLEKNLMKEVLLWAKDNPEFDSVKWEDAWRNNKPIPFDDMPAITSSYDMGWQKRSSGRRYDSHSGHAAIVGSKTRKPIAVSVLSKFCRVCSQQNSDGAEDEQEPHDCLINFDQNSSSGSMEPQALVNLSHELLDNYYCLLNTIVADDDSSVRAQMKWSNADWMIENETNQPPKIFNETTKTYSKRPDHGKLRYPYPEPAFLGDPSHRTKLVGKKCFELEAKRKEISKGLNKVDCLTIKKNFGVNKLLMITIVP